MPNATSRIDFGKPNFTWQATRDYALIFAGATLQALALRIFLVPSLLASGGVSGMAQIVNHYTHWPIGLMVLLGNLPLFMLGWRFLGGQRFAFRTIFAVLAFSGLIDLPIPFLPVQGITHDLFLNALYGGLISGIGFGLVYRGQGTSGGSDILARILHHWRGISISQSYLFTDALIIFLAGLSFSWENALYALVVLYVSGLAAEAISQGLNVARTALIVTQFPDELTAQIIATLDRGVTMLPGRGGYTQEERTILYCVVMPAEVPRLKALVHRIDEKAFMVIGHAHEALGEGFRSLSGS